MTPGDLMSEGILDVAVMGCYAATSVLRWHLSQVRDDDMRRDYLWAREAVRAARAVLVLRAGELSDACERLGIAGITEEEVRRAPFYCASVVASFLSGDEDADRIA